MVEKLFVLRNLPFSITNIAFFIYIFTFFILLKIRSIKLSRTWFIPLFAIYVGLWLSTLFGIFLNGEVSSYLSEESVFSLILKTFNPFNGKGKVFYGFYFGLILGIIVMNFVAKQKSLSLFLDISAISISFLSSVGRFGCFVSGCCYGIPSETFGISFPDGSQAFRYLGGTSLIVGNTTVPLLPTQLISSFGNLAIFLFLLILFVKRKTAYPYFYFFAQVLLYGIGRFTIEFFRIDPREFWGPLSMSQWISLVLIAVGLVFFIKNRKEIAESFKNPSHNCRDVS